MKLTELEPELLVFSETTEPFKKCDPRFDTSTEAGAKAWKEAGYPTMISTEPRETQMLVDNLAQAQAVEIDCPKCRNHRVLITFANRGVADRYGTHDRTGRPTRWSVCGTSLEDITLKPSIDCTSSNPNCWHGYITNGEVSIL